MNLASACSFVYVVSSSDDDRGTLGIGSNLLQVKNIIIASHTDDRDRIVNPVYRPIFDALETLKLPTSGDDPVYIHYNDDIDHDSEYIKIELMAINISKSALKWKPFKNPEPRGIVDSYFSNAVKKVFFDKIRQTTAEKFSIKELEEMWSELTEEEREKYEKQYMNEEAKKMDADEVDKEVAKEQKKFMKRAKKVVEKATKKMKDEGNRDKEVAIDWDAEAENYRDDVKKRRDSETKIDIKIWIDSITEINEIRELSEVAEVDPDSLYKKLFKKNGIFSDDCVEYVQELLDKRIDADKRDSDEEKEDEKNWNDMRDGDSDDEDERKSDFAFVLGRYNQVEKIQEKINTIGLESTGFLSEKSDEIEAIECFANFLAGSGMTAKQVKYDNLSELKNKFDSLKDWDNTSSDECFLAGLKNKEVANRWMKIPAIREFSILNEFDFKGSLDSRDDFVHFLAGAGFTTEKSIKCLSKAKRNELMKFKGEMMWAFAIGLAYML